MSKLHIIAPNKEGAVYFFKKLRNPSRFLDSIGNYRAIKEPHWYQALQQRFLGNGLKCAVSKKTDVIIYVYNELSGVKECLESVYPPAMVKIIFSQLYIIAGDMGIFKQ